jgi:metal-responsive CopG/Arc/MetJ family transcriptional regulator
MDKKTRRKTVSFSFNEDTIRKFDVYCSKKRINRSRLVEDLVIEFLNSKSQPKDTPKEISNVVP